ncbi:ArsR/SmtB family transcription factor [Flavobacterium rhizosphaerae]|uniref:Metalloregulator ArsR/SmtB family transcription factor n=1 Tax=Flavobacterium rhizosphaerae TaxID=3163298 RepID=A0ABW8Z077_9FLAO
MKAKEIERISKALGDPHRLRIMQEVKKQQWMPCAQICDMLDLAQPSVSHHIKQLVDAGLLIAEKEGRNIKYTIDKEMFGGYINYLNTLI